MKRAKALGKNGTNRLAWHKVAIDLQFVNKTKQNKTESAKHIKMKYAYTLINKDYLYDHIGCQV